MWHEARKHEKKIRVMIVDYRRRAERRREFYEKFKADPTQFIQIHGRPSKIYMDPQITAAADNSLMPWQGNKEITIDRFDVRAHLDFIPEPTHGREEPSKEETSKEPDDPSLNYERYRILIQNDLAGISEDKFLHQIHVEEQFGVPTPHNSKAYEKQQSKVPKAAIAYSYDDSTPSGASFSATAATTKSFTAAVEPPAEDSDEDLDFDLLLNVNDLTVAQKAELNRNGTKYGLAGGEFMNYLNRDASEREELRLKKLAEEETQTMSGRKARRERRAYKDKIILKKGNISPPSYAAPPEEERQRSSSRSDSGSRSNSPEKEKVTFITSFGGNDAGGDGPGGKTEIGPSLPPGGLPRQVRRRWNRSRTRSRSPVVRKMTARSRSPLPFGSDRRGRNMRLLDGRRGRSPSRSRSASPRIRRRPRSGHDRRRGRYNKSSSSSSRSRSRSRRRSRSSPRHQRRRRTRSRSRSSSSRRSPRRHKFSRGSSRDRMDSRKRQSIRPRRSRSVSRTWSSRRSVTPKRKSKSPSYKAKSSSKKPRSTSSSSASNSTKSRNSDLAAEKSDVSKSNGSAQESVNHEPIPVIKLPSPPPVRRYYGRERKERNSNSDSSSSSDEAEDDSSVPDSSSAQRSSSSVVHSYSKSKPSVSTAPKPPDSPASSSGIGDEGMKLTPQERLKRRMQAALNKQLKADKEAEKTRFERLEQERLAREDSLRELSIKYRRRQRERRHNTVSSAESSEEAEESDSYNCLTPGNQSPSKSPCMDMEF